MIGIRVTLEAGGAGAPGFSDGYANLTDDSLVSRAMKGSREAFGELARRYRPLAVRTAASIIGTDKAEDVVQDALILAYRALGMLQDPRRFPQWLGTITRYRALRLGKNESRRTAGQVDLDAFHGELPARSDDASGHDASDVARLETALLRIPAPFAQVLRLHFLEGLPHQAIAEKLGVTLSTSKWRCYRGKQLLRAVLLAADPVAGRVEQACARCRVHTDGVGCDGIFDETSGGPEPACAPVPGSEAGLRRRHRGHGLPTFRVDSTPDI